MDDKDDSSKGPRAKRKSRSALSAAAIVMSEHAAARRLGVSVRSLQKWRVTGKGPAFCKLGRLVGYTEQDLRAFVDANVRTSTRSIPDAAQSILRGDSLKPQPNVRSADSPSMPGVTCS